MTVVEVAPAKLNLLLHVGPPRPDGLHPLCSIFVPLDLADEVRVELAERDTVVCPRVEGENLAGRALAAYRRATPEAALPPLRVVIDKHIPVAAGLGGGSADAAATLRAADALAARPLGPKALHRLAAGLGSDVPSQLDPRPAIVGGVGEQVEHLPLPDMAFVLVPDDEGLSTPEVYDELDRMRAAGLAPARESLDAAAVRLVGASPLPVLADALENDLELAALSLRPELVGRLAALREAGALGARITGSGPTAFGVFCDRAAAEDAASRIGGAMVTQIP